MDCEICITEEHVTLELRPSGPLDQAVLKEFSNGAPDVRLKVCVKQAGNVSLTRARGTSEV